MPFEIGQTVIHELEVAGFPTRTVAVVASVAEGKVRLEAASRGGTMPGHFGLRDGRRLDASRRSPTERIVEVPAPPSDLWGPRSGWVPADTPPQREGWYEFRRANDGSVGLCYFVAGTWLTAEEQAPLALTGGEVWQGLAADPVDLYLDAEPIATEPPIQVAEPERPDEADSQGN